MPGVETPEDTNLSGRLNNLTGCGGEKGERSGILNSFKDILEGMARYAGLLLAPAEDFGRGFFCPSCKKRAFYDCLAYFRPFFVFSSNLSNF